MRVLAGQTFMGDGTGDDEKRGPVVLVDQRDADAPEKNYRRYRQNRLAVRGFLKALEIVDGWVQARRDLTRTRRVDELTYRIVDDLARQGALDLVTLGETAIGDDEAAESLARQERAHQRVDQARRDAETDAREAAAREKRREESERQCRAEQQELIHRLKAQLAVANRGQKEQEADEGKQRRVRRPKHGGTP